MSQRKRYKKTLLLEELPVEIRYEIGKYIDISDYDLTDDSISDLNELYLSLRPLYTIGMKTQFINLCKKGHLKIAKWLESNFEITKNDFSIQDKKSLFVFACSNNLLKVAKWLYLIFNISKDDIIENYLFFGSCLRNYLEMAKWICETFDIDEYDIFDISEFFLEICKNGDVNTAYWFSTRFDVGIICIPKIFIDHLNNKGHYHMANWLSEI